MVQLLVLGSSIANKIIFLYNRRRCCSSTLTTACRGNDLGYPDDIMFLLMKRNGMTVIISVPRDGVTNPKH